MARPQLYTQIDRLVGESNLRSWQFNIINLLERERCLQFLYLSIPPPVDPEALEVWEEKKAAAMSTLSTNIDPSLLDRLKGGGWDMRDQDPHKLWDAINRTIPRVSLDAVMDLTREFCRIETGDFPTLYAYLARAQTLRRRLLEIHGVDTPMFVHMLLNGIRDQYPALFEKHATMKVCDWHDVVADITYKANGQESAFNSMTAVQGTGNRSQKKGNSTPTTASGANKKHPACPYHLKEGKELFNHASSACFLIEKNIPSKWSGEARDRAIKAARAHRCKSEGHGGTT
ncbi:hypothetical protein VDGD_00288 [Verticillium dahliae]|nr:hypothetical protein VDGD_00288 [Verticillium dahliae]